MALQPVAITLLTKVLQILNNNNDDSKAIFLEVDDSETQTRIDTYKQILKQAYPFTQVSKTIQGKLK